MKGLLFDLVLRSLEGYSPTAARMGWSFESWEPMKKAVPVKIDNVYKYSIDNPHLYKKHFQPSLPKPISPFKYCFLEFNVFNKPSLSMMGIHVSCYKDDEIKGALGNYQEIYNENITAKVLMIFHAVQLEYPTQYMSPVKVFIFLDSNYSIVENKKYFLGGKGKDIKDLRDMAAQFVPIALYTFSLMNCKNTILVNNIPPNNIQKKRIKRGELPLVQYKTLLINGSTLTVNNNNPKKLKEESMMPFHIVRGNFAVYDDRPLFGKHFGTFWRSQHSRGSKELGIIVKDYSIGDPGK